MCEFLEHANPGLTELYFRRKAKKFEAAWKQVTGTFKDNRLTGKATVVYANGAVFEGEFACGMLQGFGRFEHLSLLVEGIWKDNVLQQQLN